MTQRNRNILPLLFLFPLTFPHPHLISWEHNSLEFYTEWAQIPYPWIGKWSPDSGALKVTLVPKILLPEACIWERHRPWAIPSLWKSRWITTKVSKVARQCHYPRHIVFPFTPTVWSPTPFLWSGPIRPLQPHLPEPYWTAFCFPLRVTSLSRDIQKHFKEMGWFPDQQGVYDVIKIIDLEKNQRWVN